MSVYPENMGYSELLSDLSGSTSCANISKILIIELDVKRVLVDRSFEISQGRKWFDSYVSIL